MAKTAEQKAADKAAKEAKQLASQAAKSSQTGSVTRDWHSIDGAGVKCDEPIGEKATRTANAIANQPRVATFIPLDTGEKPGQAFASPQINSFRINILKGMYVELPQQVHELIAESFKQTMNAIHGAKTVNRQTGEVKSARLDQRTDAGTTEALS